MGGYAEGARKRLRWSAVCPGLGVGVASAPDNLRESLARELRRAGEAHERASAARRRLHEAERDLARAIELGESDASVRTHRRAVEIQQRSAVLHQRSAEAHRSRASILQRRLITGHV